jgi:hypothetical protein
MDVHRVESQFLSQALDIGLADTIAATLKDIDRALGELPTDAPGAGYRLRLEGQKAGLRKPTLRMTAALVASMCVKNPDLTPRIERAFSRLIERHPDLAGFYGRLPIQPTTVSSSRPAA